MKSIGERMEQGPKIKNEAEVEPRGLEIRIQLLCLKKQSAKAHPPTPPQHPSCNIFSVSLRTSAQRNCILVKYLFGSLPDATCTDTKVAMCSMVWPGRKSK